MIKILLTTCASMIAVTIEAQVIQALPDTTSYLHGRTGMFSGIPKSSGDFYKSDLCMSSVNTATFIEFMDWMKDKVHYPGMQVGILHDGELIWKHNWGLASIEQAKPVTDSTLFRLLSVSKTMVVTAMMQQAEDGLIDLNGNINDYLPFDVINPWYPQAVVSPKMVLNHTASLSDDYPGSGPECGLLEYLGDPQVSLHDYLQSHFVPGGICYANSSYFNQSPGTYCYYSNPGASLGGYLVEAVAGKGFNEYCNESIFVPLDMPTSRWYYSELDTAVVANMYHWNGTNFFNAGARSYAGYPQSDLKSNVTELSNFLKMYLNHGMYNGTRLLDSTSVDLITTINDTLLPSNAPIGLIWQYWPAYNLWYHDGAAGASVNFNEENNTGFVLTDNRRVGQYEPTLAGSHLMATYAEFAVSSIRTIDENGNGINEAGETIEVFVSTFNNLMNDADNVHISLSCSEQGVQLIDSVAVLGTIGAGTSADNQGQPFRFYISNIQEPHTVMMDLKVQYDGSNAVLIHFPLFLGQGNVLLVKDERDVLNSERFYLDVLDSLGMKTHYWDIAINGNPDSTFLNNFPAIIWYTGYDADSTINEANQSALMKYLDQGGRLFMTGQNISDEIGNTVFMSDYLHASHISNYTILQIKGVDGDLLGDGIIFNLNDNYLMPNQYSQSRIAPVNGGTASFKFGNTTAMAGVRFENDMYKTVFLGVGFEAIGLISSRYTLMHRILEYFGVLTGEDETITTGNDTPEIKLIPNPAGDKVTIESHILTGICQLSIYNVNGKKVMEKQLTENETQIDISALPKGFYFVMLQNEKMVEVGKLIKE